MTRSPAADPIGTGAEGPPKVTPEIAAEAAVWIARLHGPSRTRQMEQEFRAWQESSPAHRVAFERCTDAWQDIPRIGLAAAYEGLAASERAASARAGAGLREAARRWITASAVAGAVAAGVVFALQWHDQNAYRTNVGEQRLVVLEDGSRMLLNTDTRLHVDFASSQRTVEVRSGEAFFEVAKDARRPFVVRIAGSEVVAVGTAFSVRYAPSAHAAGELAVTLVEGQAKVRAAGKARDVLAPEQPVWMKPGDRLLLDRPPGQAASRVVARLDRPNVERVLAWKRDEAVFEDTSLADAVAEMNRYNRTPIVLLDGLESAGLRVSGLYHTGDSTGFANAVAALHGLDVHEEGGRLELAKPH